MLPGISAIIAAIVAAVALLTVSFALVATVQVARDHRTDTIQADLAQRTRAQFPPDEPADPTLIADLPRANDEPVAEPKTLELMEPEPPAAGQTVLASAPAELLVAAGPQLVAALPAPAAIEAAPAPTLPPIEIARDGDTLDSDRLAELALAAAGATPQQLAAAPAPPPPRAEPAIGGPLPDHTGTVVDTAEAKKVAAEKAAAFKRARAKERAKEAARKRQDAARRAAALRAAQEKRAKDSQPFGNNSFGGSFTRTN